TVAIDEHPQPADQQVVQDGLRAFNTAVIGDGNERPVACFVRDARGRTVGGLVGHVVNFDVPGVPEDYIHRVGRTARAEATGEAFTMVSPEEEGELKGIERAIGKRLPRVILPDFDYKARTEAKLEVPLKDRIAEIRARKAAERARAKAKEARRTR
ncbi:MAG TPA: helicase-related protein, partial [Gemmatimonadaceae bacterium]|nr:helicase-related protein [Gemmatimonadaceae bacterium]